jgi:hypothetical protein
MTVVERIQAVLRSEPGGLTTAQVAERLNMKAATAGSRLSKMTYYNEATKELVRAPNRPYKVAIWKPSDSVPA